MYVSQSLEVSLMRPCLRNRQKLERNSCNRKGGSTARVKKQAGKCVISLVWGKKVVQNIILAVTCKLFSTVSSRRSYHSSLSVRGLG